MSRSDTDKKPIRKENQLRQVADELDRRRDRIAKIQRARSVLVGAYDLVAADLRAACERESDTP
jgi:hypothetical protein